MIGKFDVLKNLTHAFQAESISGLLDKYMLISLISRENATWIFYYFKKDFTTLFTFQKVVGLNESPIFYPLKHAIV